MALMLLVFVPFGMWIHFKSSNASEVRERPVKKEEPQAPASVNQASSAERIFLSDTIETIAESLKGKTSDEWDMIVRDKYLGKWIKESFSFQDRKTKGDKLLVTLYVEGKRGFEMLNYPPIVAIMDTNMLPRITHRKVGESLQVQGEIRFFNDLEVDLVNAEVLN